MLAGYRPGLSAADPLFRLMLLQHAVCHVALLAERRFPIVDAAYRWFLRRRWRRDRLREWWSGLSWNGGQESRWRRSDKAGD